ncbi:AAA family ATPase [Halobacterium salinarum]|uniref:AAA family ATPase n=1 Tax=Halobacterium salinarum TaxID=2242 RepID=UPI0025554B94|nr:ATP-binding protein [Halobacterium salinarum]MDL0122395.1 ATP-binding protein [Halobacterium salinarum]MDL0131913.1 ATP-binding protein [Halobacterium salinarum]
MTIRIESLRVENLRCFIGEHTLNFDKSDGAAIEAIAGGNATGKTTLADSIRLCLTGTFAGEKPLVTHELIDQSPGNDGSGNVSIVLSDSELGRRFRFARQFHTAETRRGPVNTVDSLQVEEETDGTWTHVSSADAVNTVFPRPAFTFCKLDSQSLIGINNSNNGISWNELVESLGDAAAQQSVARGVELPEYFGNDYDLADELLRRINHSLESIDSRFRVEEREDGLVVRRAENGAGDVIQHLATGDRLLISQVAAFAAAELLPETPPLIGDSIFGRVDSSLRQDLMGLVQEMDRHVLLFATELEFEDLAIEPRLKLVLNQEDMHCHTVSLE